MSLLSFTFVLEPFFDSKTEEDSIWFDLILHITKCNGGEICIGS